MQSTTSSSSSAMVLRTPAHGWRNKAHYVVDRMVAFGSMRYPRVGICSGAIHHLDRSLVAPDYTGQILDCPICLNLAHDPLQFSDCKHVVCSACFHTYRQQSPHFEFRCPVCRTNIRHSQCKALPSMDADLRFSYLATPVRCPHPTCGYKDNESRIFIHEKWYCPKRPIACPSPCCPVVGVTDLVKRHFAECNNYSIYCRKCRLPKRENDKTHDCITELGREVDYCHVLLGFSRRIRGTAGLPIFRNYEVNPPHLDVLLDDDVARLSQTFLQRGNESTIRRKPILQFKDKTDLHDLDMYENVLSEGMGCAGASFGVMNQSNIRRPPTGEASSMASTTVTMASNLSRTQAEQHVRPVSQAISSIGETGPIDPTDEELQSFFHTLSRLIPSPALTIPLNLPFSRETMTQDEFHEQVRQLENLAAEAIDSMPAAVEQSPSEDEAGDVEVQSALNKLLNAFESTPLSTRAKNSQVDPGVLQSGNAQRPRETSGAAGGRSTTPSCIHALFGTKAEQEAMARFRRNRRRSQDERANLDQGQAATSPSIRFQAPVVTAGMVIASANTLASGQARLPTVIEDSETD